MRETYQAKAYHYQRFSESRQGEGDSVRRQKKYVLDWCEKHKVELVEEVVDHGVSGYHGEHAVTGGLSRVLTAIRNGEISKGDYLLVENFDRMGREHVQIAMSRLLEIIALGVRVVTLMDGKVFDDTSDGTDLMLALVVMMRANEESATKSNRANSVHMKKREMIKSGGKMPKMRVPVWLSYNDREERYFLNEHADKVALIFDLYLSGMGSNLVCRELNEREIKPLGHSKQWTISTVLTVLKNPIACGDYELDGEIYENRLPAVITKERFLTAKSEIAGRKVRTRAASRTGTTTNLLTGIAKCACGMPMNLTGKDRKLANGGTASYKYLICSSSRARAKHCGLTPIRYKFVETALIQILTIVNGLPKESVDVDQKNALIERLGAKRAIRDELTKKRDNLFELVADLGKSDALTDKIIKCENEIASAKTDISDIEVQINEVSAHIETSDSMHERLKKISKEVGDSEYRNFLIRYLPKVISEFTFHHDHRITAVIHGKKIATSGIKGRFYIRADDEIFDAYVNPEE